jgi:hypothetical protein
MDRQCGRGRRDVPELRRPAWLDAIAEDRLYNGVGASTVTTKIARPAAPSCIPNRDHVSESVKDRRAQSIPPNPSRHDPLLPAGCPERRRLGGSPDSGARGKPTVPYALPILKES